MPSAGSEEHDHEGQDHQRNRHDPNGVLPPPARIDRHDPIAAIRALLRVLVYGFAADGANKKIVPGVLVFVDPLVIRIVVVCHPRLD